MIELVELETDLSTTPPKLRLPFVTSSSKDDQDFRAQVEKERQEIADGVGQFPDRTESGNFGVGFIMVCLSLALWSSPRACIDLPSSIFSLCRDPTSISRSRRSIEPNCRVLTFWMQHSSLASGKALRIALPQSPA